MENLIKGWATSLAGFAGMVCTFLHGFGIYTFPKAAFLSTSWECLIAFVASLFLCIAPKTKIEEILEGVIKKKSDQI